MLSEFASEQQALDYIKANEHRLFDELEQLEIRSVFNIGNTRINIMKEGKRLIRVINRYDGDKKIHDVFKDIIDLGLLSHK